MIISLSHSSNIIVGTHPIFSLIKSIFALVFLTSPFNSGPKIGFNSNPEYSIIIFAKSNIDIDEFVPTLKNSWSMLLSIDMIFAFATSST